MNINEIMPYIGFLIPVLIIQLALLVIALINVIKHDHFKLGNKVVWIIIVVCIGIIGPILYFTLGRSDE